MPGAPKGTPDVGRIGWRAAKWAASRASRRAAAPVSCSLSRAAATDAGMPGAVVVTPGVTPVTAVMPGVMPGVGRVGRREYAASRASRRAAALVSCSWSEGVAPRCALGGERICWRAAFAASRALRRRAAALVGCSWRGAAAAAVGTPGIERVDWGAYGACRALRRVSTREGTLKEAAALGDAPGAILCCKPWRMRSGSAPK